MNKKIAQIDHFLNLTRIIAKTIDEDWKANAKTVNLTQPQQHILWLLYFLGGSGSMSILAKMGCWHISTVMDITARIAEKGLVEIYQDEKDLRVTVAKITPKGEKLRKQSEENGLAKMRIYKIAAEKGELWFDNLLSQMRELCIMLNGEETVREFIDNRYELLNNKELA
jgi:MarR family protease production transcriptional regulator HPr